MKLIQTSYNSNTAHILLQNLQQLHEKIKTLEQPQISRTSPATVQLTPRGGRRDGEGDRKEYKSPDLVVDMLRPIPTIPVLNLLPLEESAMETKKKEMEITKEFAHRKSFSRECMALLFISPSF